MQQIKKVLLQAVLSRAVSAQGIMFSFSSTMTELSWIDLPNRTAPARYAVAWPDNWPQFHCSQFNLITI